MEEESAGGGDEAGSGVTGGAGGHPWEWEVAGERRALLVGLVLGGG